MLVLVDVSVRVVGKDEGNPELALEEALDAVTGDPEVLLAAAGAELLDEARTGKEYDDQDVGTVLIETDVEAAVLEAGIDEPSGAVTGELGVELAGTDGEAEAEKELEAELEAEPEAEAEAEIEAEAEAEDWLD